MIETSVGAREEGEAESDEACDALPRTTSETETELPADGHSTDHGSETVARTSLILFPLDPDEARKT